MVDSAARQVKRSFTYADYKVWELTEGEHYGLTGGVPCAMPVPAGSGRDL
ncbi:MAG: hypothetical protein LBB77_12535 [Treponema sp.]|jgi:hypothetical protein|nr:hypothetical protein [Treponema sp.]